MDGIQAVPVRTKRPAPGWYTGRLRAAAKGERWQIVAVYHLQQGAATRIAVFQIGSVEPEPLSRWRLRGRIIGVEEIPDRPKPVPAVETAVVLPLELNGRARHFAS